MPDAPAPGFYGKVPALGDFVSRRMPSGFLLVWDAWLQQLVRASRDALGAAWLDAWNEAPVWHFALGAGIAGPVRWAGVLIPSVDRVGRQFPFSILGPVRQDGLPQAEWALQVERMAIAALDDGFDPARLDAELQALGGAAPDAALAELSPGETFWQCRDAARVPATTLRRPGLPDAADCASMVSRAAV